MGRTRHHGSFEIQKAGVVMKRYRAAIERLYTGVMDVIERRAVKDETTKLTSFEEVTVLENEPCRLSFSSSGVNEEVSGAYNVTQEIKVFCAPELDIKPGSKLVITQNNVTNSYVHTGKSAVYSNHREIVLELFKEWA